MRPPRVPTLAALACVLTAIVAPAPASAGSDTLAAALAAGELKQAEYALERARALFHVGAVRAHYPGAEQPDPHDATLVLRDLRAALPALEPDDREAAARILARPTDAAADGSAQGYRDGLAFLECGTNICVHWVEASADAPPLTDGDLSGVPDWVETTRRTFEEAWAYEVGVLGYRSPNSDAGSANNGGDERLDVYLADIGDQGYFGYCTTDDPTAAHAFDVSAYCVVDDDFLNAAFGGGPPLRALRATAAHELFHAVQFAYDWLEDGWLMEGTAAWVEDEVYDDADDNRVFLHAASPLAMPGVSLDDGRRGHEYGAWIFWRYLSERFGAALVRGVWERAESPSAEGGAYSLEAVEAALAARGLSFRDAFASFGTANRVPASRYSEGSAYPASPAAASYGLSPMRPRVAPRSVRVARLANSTVSFRPGRATRGALRLDVSAVDGGSSAAATAIVVRRSGDVLLRPVRLGPTGHGSVVVRFAQSRVRRVDLVLTNASTALACWQGTAFSCRGLPLAADAEFRFAARLAR